MSHSPDQAVTGADTRAYTAARVELERLRGPTKSWSGRQRTCFFLNTGGRRFANVSATSGADFPEDGRAVGVVDWDRDGDLDIWLTNRTGPMVRFLSNETPSDHHYLSVRLVGSTVNRDAIGARLEAHLGGESRRRLIKTIRAGDAFLSQSSKEVHFGLGEATRVERLVVRWPGGDVEELSELQADRRYVIVQGRDTAVEARIGQPVRLATREQALPAEAGGARILLAAPIPAPAVTYEDFAGRSITLPADSGPVLINLWASWCAPCVTELTEFQRRRSELKEAGVRVLALSVDGLGGDNTTVPADAQRLVDELGFSLEAGHANDHVLDTFNLLYGRIISRPRPLPVPTSFLVDGQGLLVAIYKGPVSIDQLIRDTVSLRHRTGDRFSAALPFPGRRHVLGWPQFFEYVDGIAEVYTEGGYPEEAVALYRNVAHLRPRDPQAHVNLATALAGRGQSEEAIASYRQVLILDPENVEALNNLALELARQGNDREAEIYFRKAVSINPDEVTPHVNLGLALKRLGRLDEAAVHFNEALSLQGSLAATRKLAWTLATHPDPSIRNSERAILLAERIDKATEDKQPAFLDVLAAAYASAGRFEEAVAAAGKAIELALLQGDNELARTVQARLDLYKTGHPFRTAPGAGE